MREAIIQESTHFITPHMSQNEKIKLCIQKMKSDTRTWLAGTAAGVATVCDIGLTIYFYLMLHGAGKEASVLKMYANTPDGSYPPGRTCGTFEPMSDVCRGIDGSIDPICERAADQLCATQTPFAKAAFLLFFSCIALLALGYADFLLLAKRKLCNHKVSDLRADTKELIQNLNDELNLDIDDDTLVENVLNHFKIMVAQSTIRTGARNYLLASRESTSNYDIKDNEQSPGRRLSNF